MNQISSYRPEAFFDLDGPVAELFKPCTYVWEAIALLPAFIEGIITPGIKGEVEEGAWLEPGRVQLGEGSRVERGAIVRGPTIIGPGTVVRTGAYIRGQVMTGEGCMIGHGTEVRQILVLDQTNIPHSNCFFTSLVGSRVRIGGHTSTANFRLDKGEIAIRVPVEGKMQSFPTGQTLLGAVIGDDSAIGGQSILQPGTLIGPRCRIYNHCSVSGHIPPDSTVKPKSLPFEIFPRREVSLSHDR